MRRLLLILLVLQSHFAFARVNIEQAQLLIDTGQYDQAYLLLKGRNGNDVMLHYLYGVAAMETGRINEAIFAFERVLGMQPDFHDARIAIAQAYLTSGENAAALIEFEMLSGQALTPDQQHEVSTGIAAAKSNIARTKRKIRGSVGIGGGYDTNVNAGPDDTSVTIPTIGALALTANNREQNDAFGMVQGDIHYTQLLKTNKAFFAGAKFESRTHMDENDFDYLAMRAYAGGLVVAGKSQYKFNLVGQKYWVDGESNQNQVGVQGRWKHQYNEVNAASAFLQATNITYPDQSVRDVNQYVAGISWEHKITHPFNPVFIGSIYGATDREETSSRDDIGRNFYGVQLGVEARPDTNNTWYATLNYQHSKYGATDPVFQVKRKDNLTHASVGWSHKFHDNWSIQPEVRFTRNSSTVPVNDFDRAQVFILAKRAFQ